MESRASRARDWLAAGRGGPAVRCSLAFAAMYAVAGRPGPRAFNVRVELLGAAWTGWREPSVPQTIEGPVPVLPELLVAVAVRLAGQGDAPSTVPHCRWPGVRLWLWSEVAMCLDLQLRAELPDRRRYRHETIMSCLVVLVHAVFGQFISWSRARAVWHPGHVPLVCARTDPCLSFTARSSSVSRPPLWRQCVAALSGNWCVRRRLKYVCFSCRAGPSTDRSTGSRAPVLA